MSLVSTHQGGYLTCKHIEQKDTHLQTHTETEIWKDGKQSTKQVDVKSKHE
jgi:hypothetical protein